MLLLTGRTGANVEDESSKTPGGPGISFDRTIQIGSDCGEARAAFATHYCNENFPLLPITSG